MKINLYSNYGLDPYMCTSNKNYNKYVEWTLDGSADVSFYFDYQIPNGLVTFDNKKKYAWLLESREIVPHVIEYVKNNYQTLSFQYEAIFTCNRDLLSLGPKMKYAVTNAVPWVQKREITKKTKLVSMISSNKTMCNGHKNRLKWVDKFKDKVDLYGSGFKWIDNKEEGIEDYMFSIAIENSSYNTYFTEKLTDCFALGTVPIFYGNPDIKDIFNPDGIIFLNDDFDINCLNEDLYYSKMSAIKENLEITKNMITAEDYIYLNYLK